MCFPWENTLAFADPHTKTKSRRMATFFFGRGTKARTLDTRFWRPLLYQLSYTPKWCMFDSAVRACSEPSHAGAGDGNRTRTASLEGWNSTIELHPQNQRLIIVSHRWIHVKRFLIFLPLFRQMHLCIAFYRRVIFFKHPSALSAANTSARRADFGCAVNRRAAAGVSGRRSGACQCGGEGSSPFATA